MEMRSANPPGSLERELKVRWWTVDDSGRSRRDVVVDGLRARSPAIDRDLRGIPLAGEDLSELDLTGFDLSGAGLSGCNLYKARLLGAQLDEAVLVEANLESAELSGASLVQANLSEAHCARVGFGKADLRGAVLFGADFSGASFACADLAEVDARTASFESSVLREASLHHADLSQARLVRADFGDCDLSDAVFDRCEVSRTRFSGARNYRSASFLGVEIDDARLTGAHLLRRHVVDQNYLHEFRRQSPSAELVYKLWWLTSDCGRSFLRWGLWCLFITVVYALIYSFVNISYGSHPTPLSPLYYSVVTITTLGYGDALPASMPAQIACMSQVIIGYIMLGGLLSIFASRMGRRGD